MKHFLAGLLLLTLIALYSRIVNAENTPSPATTAMSAAAFLVNAENNSNETGTVFVTPLTITKTQILIVVTGEPRHSTQPAHIHHGSCGQMSSAPAFALNPLINGRSKTTIPDSIGDVLSGNYAVNIHESANNADVYVACAELSPSNAATRLNSIPPATSRTAASPAPSRRMQF